MTEISEPQAQRVCLNCNHPLQADFCAHCGQRAKEVRRPVLYFLQELLHVVLELDGRAYRTIFYLLIRPGFLTREYFEGRRVRYTPPLRLFLVVSIGFFLIISLFSSVQGIRNDMLAIANPQAVPEVVEATEDTDGPGDEEQISTALEDAPVDEGYDGVIAILDGISLPFFSEATNSNLRSVLVTQFETNIEELMEDPQEFITGSLEYITFFVLLLMPVLALIQQILWVFSRRYYVEHLVLTVHNHAFLIVMIFLTIPLGMLDDAAIPILSPIASGLSVAAVFWIFIYLCLSLKRYFERGWFVTLTLFLVASIAYSIVFGIGLVGFALMLVLFA